MRSIGQSCAVSGTLYFFFALLIQRFPSANASLPYFAVISAFLFLNHFPFLLKSIKTAVMNISLIFTNRNAITAITFFCYSVSVKLSLLSVYFSITAILFCGYFYVLFVNLVCGFGYGGISSRGQAIKILCASFFLAVGLPGLIWYQHRRLMKLENLLHDLFEICDKIK